MTTPPRPRIIALLRQERGGTDDSAFEIVFYVIWGIIAFFSAQLFFRSTSNIFLATILGIIFFVLGSGIYYLAEKLVTRIGERLFRERG